MYSQNKCVKEFVMRFNDPICAMWMNHFNVNESKVMNHDAPVTEIHFDNFA